VNVALDAVQAEAILKMQLRTLAALERRKIEEEYAHGKREILRLSEILSRSVPLAPEPLDERKLKQVARLSKLASQLWLEITERNQHRPAPISVFDQFIQMAPIVEMRGDAATVDFTLRCSRKWTSAGPTSA
jgi:benzoyl-CoA reductase/2-hydroxyglutaryl-CoA dehydratase subunit BcrC/BadD/HgdB